MGAFGSFYKKTARRTARGICMEVILANAFPTGALVALTAIFRLLHDKTKFKKIWLICDVLVHIALVGFMLYVDATMEELLLVLLATLAIGMV